MIHLSAFAKTMIFLVIVGCHSFFDCSAQDKIPSAHAVKIKIDTYVQQVMKKFELPGIAIAVARDGETIYMNAFGMRNVETKEALQTRHIFHMASVAKPFVAMAIVQLVEQKKMNLDEPLVKYLPYFKLADERYEKITIRQMLNHTSGMPDVIDYEWEKPQTDDGAAERYVRSLKKEKMIAAPGERYQYSNMAYDVLGDLIAKVSGKPFEVYMKENILNPLGMTESSFLLENIKKDLRTSPHIWKSKPVVSEIYPYNRFHAPSSTLNSNVVEMLHWAEANLQQGKPNGARLVSEANYALLVQPSVRLSEKTSIGLGWVLSEYRGLSTVEHSGDDLGYCCDFKLIPQKKIGIIVASNYELTPVSSILNSLIDILLGLDPEVPKKSVASYFRRIMEKDGIAAAKAAYHEWYKKAPGDYNFGPQALNSLGYRFIRKKEMAKALGVFLFNAELFPENSNVHDSLAEAYMVTGDSERAIEHYKKSLELNPANTQAIEMLKKLKEMKNDH